MPSPIADHLFFVVTDPVTGKPTSEEPGRSTSLAAGLVCELLLAGQARLNNDLIQLTQAPITDPWQAAVGDHVRQYTSEARPSELTSLLSQLRATAPQLIAERLISRGEAAIQQRRRLGRAQSTVVATDGDQTTRWNERLAAYLRNNVEPEHVEGAIVASLALSADRRGAQLGLNSVARSYTGTLLEALPSDIARTLMLLRATVRPDPRKRA